MRKILLILFVNLLFSNQFFSQNIYDGKFELTNHLELHGWEYDEFVFKKDSSFQFTRRTDYGDFIGIGMYRLTKSKLILTFKKLDRIPDTISSYYIVDSTYSSGDSIHILVKLKSTLGETLKGGICVVRTHNKEETINGVETDKNGEAKLIFPRTVLPINILFTYVGYNRLNITYDDYLNKEITVFLKDSPVLPTIISDSVMIFKLRKINDSEFYVKRPEVEYWLHYHKMK